MKNSRLFIMLVLIIISLVSTGAILGSLLAKYTIVYTSITVVAIALLIFAWFFYTGQKKDKKHAS